MEEQQNERHVKMWTAALQAPDLSNIFQMIIVLSSSNEPLIYRLSDPFSNAFAEKNLITIAILLLS